MKNEHQPRNRSIKKILLFIFLLLSIACVYLYNNFNKLLSEALLRNFNDNVISDVYELNFDKLNVNFLQGNISVFNVTLKPREKPLNNYSYINSSFRLFTGKVQLTNVHILELLKQNKFNLDKIEILNPEIQLKLSGKFPIFFPIKDTSENLSKKTNKKFIEYFLLKEFQLANASIQVFNSYKQRDVRIGDFNIKLNNLEINQKLNSNAYSVNKIDLLIGEFSGKLLKEPVKLISFKNYRLQIDSLYINKSIDTLIYKFNDYKIGFNDLNVHTADSIFNIKLQSFNLSYKDKSINLKGISYKPNIDQTIIQKKFKFQNTQFSGYVSSVNLVNLNFDSLIYYRKLFIDEIVLDKVNATIFKNNAKPVDITKFPGYLGAIVKSIPLSLSIKRVKVVNANLTYIELKPDLGIAKTNINRGTVIAENITNISKERPLTVNAKVFLENKVHVNTILAFSYIQPQFSVEGNLDKFKLSDLNSVIGAYTPAKINNGVVDEIKFSGTIFNSYSTGTMKFLYHDLQIDLNLKNKAKWKSSIGAFAANTYLHSSNPQSPDLPPRIVKFRAERLMNKGFINIIVKSIVAGLKETMILSKENRKEYNKSVKKHKQKNRK